jgi:hypothetical protein
MAARELPVSVALAALSATVALAFGAVFASGAYVAPLVGAALLPHAIGWVTRRWTRSGTRGAATVALGQLTVIVPAGVTVDMQGHAGAGEIDLLGHVVDGLNIDAASVAAGGATETVHLNLRVGFGQVNVVRAPAVPAAPARTP